MPQTNEDIFKTIRTQDVTLTTAEESYLIPGYPIPNRKLLIIYNNSAWNIFIGGSDVTTSNGLPLKTGDYIILSIPNFVYAVSEHNAQTIYIMELS